MNFYFFREEKEIDFAEQVESVAYVLCGEGTINFDKFQHIWHAKGVSILKTVVILSFNCMDFLQCDHHKSYGF